MEPSQKVQESHYVFLKGLPDNTPQHPYISCPDIYEKVKSHEQTIKETEDASSFIVFLDVPLEAFEEAVLPESSPLEHCRFAYARALRCLVLEILSAIHETAREAMVSLFDSKISEMGLYSSLRRPGPLARTYDQVTKQPDAQWLPCVPGEDPSKPTVFLEVAASESQLRVESDAKRWLTYPDSPMMMVLTVKVFDYPKVNTQVLAGLRKPQFAMAGTNSEANITRSNGTTHVEGALIVPFEFIFWREKNKENPKEQDVVLKDQDLQSLAETIWRAQGLM